MNDVRDLLAKLHGARERINPNQHYDHDGLTMRGEQLLEVTDAAITLLKALGDDAIAMPRLKQLLEVLEDLP